MTGGERRAGFSLLEVLVAFAIMALVLSALIPGQVGLLQRATQSGERVLAQDYALSRLAGLGLSEPFPSGTQEARYGNWRVIEAVEVKAPGIIQVSVTVYSGPRLLAEARRLSVSP